MKFRSVLAAAMMLSASALSANAACTTDTPVSVDDLGGAIGTWSNGGTHSFNGSADCSRAIEDAQMDSAALAAALSTPVWLEPGEKFAISGGLGFSDGSTAVGATGIVRFGSNLSGFVGGAFNTDDTDLWAGKVGLRAGF
jgi:hypothetical protein